ncbi:Leucine carboxyl methyltransferase, partial [Globisporangium splendens]
MASRSAEGGAHDSAVMETASDASLCKLSASALGYYKDPYIQYFVKSPSRRMPIINRGYYARVAAVETLVTKFLAAETEKKKKQVVILGAGLDTMFFRLKEAGQLQQCEYFELDFPDVTMQKVMIIKRRKPLANLVGLATNEEFIAAVSSGYAELNAPGYHLLPCDLRDINATKQKLEAAGIDQSAPTLFISECVLIYMDAQYSTQLIAWSAEFFEDVSYVLYEQILPDDAFGRVMMANIKARGCDLISIRDFPTLEAQIERFRVHHFEAVQAWDMNQIYYKYLDAAERAK